MDKYLYSNFTEGPLINLHFPLPRLPSTKREEVWLKPLKTYLKHRTSGGMTGRLGTVPKSGEVESRKYLFTFARRQKGRDGNIKTSFDWTYSCHLIGIGKPMYRAFLSVPFKMFKEIPICLNGEEWRWSALHDFTLLLMEEIQNNHLGCIKPCK